jgi:predicted acetyltransferase
MIIRPLRPDENYKCSSVGSIAYSFSSDLNEEAQNELKSEVFGAFSDDGETIMATIYPNSYYSNYCGTYLPSVGIGSVATLPEYRRCGCIRAIFDEIFRIAPERGWATSFLYPFSYTYYRQFGYERVIQKKTIRIPVSVLNIFERNTNAVLYDNISRIGDILKVYEKYAIRYNMMFRRDEKSHAYSTEPHKSKKWTYIWYNKEGAPVSYATITVDNGCLNVKELAYSDKAGLCGIIGFLRMFEGQVHEFYFSDLPIDSELDYIINSYSECDYKLHNSAMGRVLLADTLLRFNKYPNEPGHFRLRVNDTLDYNNGVYEVEYADGKSEVKKHADGEYDIAADIPSLSRIMFGCDSYDAEKAVYLSGITLNNDADDFFRAFPKRKHHLHDYF